MEVSELTKLNKMNKQELIKQVTTELERDRINKEYILTLIASHENYKAREAYNEVIDVEKMGVIERVCFMFDTTELELKSKKRDGVKPLARYLLFINYINIKLPLKQIGSMFGGRDHAAVINGIRRIRNLHSTKDQLLMHHANRDIDFFEAIMNGEYFE